MITALQAAFSPETRSTVRDGDSWISRWFKGTDDQWGLTSASGEVVTWATALGLTAYFASIRNIAEDIAKLPKKVYQNDPQGGKKELRNHPIRKLVHDMPNDEMTAMSFWETMLFHAVGRKGAYAEIERDGGGRAKSLWPLDPGRVTMKRSGITKEIVYAYRQDTGQEIGLAPENVFHIHGIGLDGLTGLILANLAKESIGGALGAQKHAAAFFGNAASPEGFISIPNKLSEQGYKYLRESFDERHVGADRHYKTIILEQGGEWKPYQIDPDKSQLDMTRKLGIEEACRLMRMPPNKVQHLERATYNNIAEENRAYATDTLQPWAVRVEQEGKRKLFLPAEDALFMEIDFDALMRADVVARWTAHKEARYAGAVTGNEIRKKENMNPGGEELDTYWAPVNMMDARMLPLQFEQAQAEPEPVSPDAPEPPDNEPQESQDARAMFTAIAQAHEDQLRSALERIHRVECDKVKRRVKRDDYGDWRNEFYSGHMDYVRGPVRDVIVSYVRCIRAIWDGCTDNPEDINARVELIITRYINEKLALTVTPESAVEELWRFEPGHFAGACVAEILEDIEAAYMAETSGELANAT